MPEHTPPRPAPGRQYSPVPTHHEPSNPDAERPSLPRRVIRSRAASPLRLVIFAFLSFHPSAMPWLARPNYARELRAAFFLPWVLAATEGGVVGFIVRKLYDGIVDDTLLNILVGVVATAPALANITSFIWSSIAQSRPKIRMITGLQLGIVIAVAAMSIAPRSAQGVWVFVAAALAARVCIAGIVTIRATVWGVNYTQQRATVTGKFQTITLLLNASAIILLGTMMQIDERWYRVLVPIGGLVALIGISNYARIRVRGQRALLSAERSASTAASNVITRILAVYRKDRDFTRYQLCQFTMGFGNLMTIAPFVIIAKEQFNLDYLPGLVFTQILPMGLMPFFIPLWARLLDRVHIIRFRAIHSWVFVAVFLVAIIACQLDILWMIFLAAALRGVAFGGGALAWNLGHLQFVKPDRATDYMAAHVTLTGVRGLIAPIVGVGLYELIESTAPGEGSWVFLVGSAFTITGAIGFALLARALPDAGRTQTAPT